MKNCLSSMDLGCDVAQIIVQVKNILSHGGNSTCYIVCFYFSERDILYNSLTVSFANAN